METIQEQTIGQMVATDYRMAAIFKKYQIDFCCNGNRTINEVCAQQAIDKVKLEQDLSNLSTQSQANEEQINFKYWPLDLLVDYIEKKHHRYVREQLPAIHQYLNKIVNVHGKQHPELAEVNALFEACSNDLLNHMKKEEMILFPFIKNLSDAKTQASLLKPTPFGTIENPIQMMMHEHDTEGDRFRKISALTHNYQAPADACQTYKITFALLKEFEDDLHQHIHLENNILFPAAVTLENALNSAHVIA